jgi:hypothetical protein
VNAGCTWHIVRVGADLTAAKISREMELRERGGATRYALLHRHPYGDGFGRGIR